MVSNSQTKNRGRLHFMGRASIRIESADGIVIYIDPYAGKKKEYKVPADLVLVTHQHGDHNKVSLVKLNEGGKVIQCPFDIKSGDTIETQNIKVTAVEAYNKNHDKDSNCGYIIDLGGLVIYHSGDTSTTAQMTGLADYNIDYALLCTDGYYNMGVEEAMQVSKMIKAKHVIPMHTSPKELYSQETIDSFTLENKITVRPGETISLG